jgi:C-terminal processing protease CtpA/Prc
LSLCSVEAFAQTPNPEAVFLDVWQHVDEHFYDEDFNGVDWCKMKAKYLPRAKKCRTAEQLSATVNEMLAELRTSHTDGWGGASTEYLNLFNKNVPKMTWYGRGEKETKFDSQWREPVALLINGGTRSGKELLAFGFKKFNIGTVIGTTTAGAVTGGRLFLLGDGSILYLAVRGVKIDGEVLEGKGVEPDITVPYEFPYGGPEDPQLKKAIEILTTSMSPRPDCQD